MNANDSAILDEYTQQLKDLITHMIASVSTTPVPNDEQTIMDHAFAMHLLQVMFNESLTLISTIKGFAQVLLLEKDGSLTTSQREAITRIHKSVQQVLILRSMLFTSFDQQRHVWSSTEGRKTI